MWDDIRVSAEVVRQGSVSAAADALGIHRATVNRRIDALETYIGGKLFQRHSHGYTPTELGRDLLQIADDAEMQIERLRLRAFGGEEAITGDLIITSIDAYAPIVLCAMADFSQRFPKINVSYVASNSPLKLELGDAHIAFRVGRRPEENDYVVIPHKPVQMGLYASQSYLKRHGEVDKDNLAQQKFVVPRASPGDDPPDQWLVDLVDTPNIVLVSNQVTVVESALKAGLGIGFFPIHDAELDKSLVPILPPDPSWYVDCWIVTHVDLHRSAKVQAFLKYCRETGLEPAA